MKREWQLALPVIIFAGLLAGCGIGTVVTAPIDAAQAVWWTGKTAAKGTYYVGKGTANVLAYPFRDDELEGIASWSGPDSGEKPARAGDSHDLYKMTAAHNKLPLGSFAEVSNVSNGKKVVVMINSRGPLAEDIVIDLSYAAAEKIDMISNGSAQVKIRVIE
jgi:rare lipoprotein A (peptidoglycan hydrolase)